MPRWIWTCRPGYERDLASELPSARVVGAALVESNAPSERTPIFARQGFPIHAEVEATVEVCAPHVAQLGGDADFTLHAWVPDTDEGNAHSATATELRKGVLESLGRAGTADADPKTLAHRMSPLIQIALLRDRALIGTTPARDAQSLFPGGRARMKVPFSRPSRSTRKLAEAFAVFRVEPERGDLCVDLGAAPGGWTWLLLKLGARVIAVDRAHLDREIPRKGLIHVRENAHTFAPDEPVDWLFCDMVDRPNAVAKLLARWAEKKWTRQLLANVKLPMKRRAETIDDVLKTMARAGWRGLRGRHLYHDRDEVTLTGYR